MEIVAALVVKKSEIGKLQAFRWVRKTNEESDKGGEGVSSMKNELRMDPSVEPWNLYKEFAFAVAKFFA